MRTPRRLPRMRGDRPAIFLSVALIGQATPHARGSTADEKEAPPNRSGYPACAGIDLRDYPAKHERHRLPRMRGDRPRRGPELPVGREATPHARGSTLTCGLAGSLVGGYPACAGIDPSIADM